MSCWWKRWRLQGKEEREKMADRNNVDCGSHGTCMKSKNLEYINHSICSRLYSTYTLFASGLVPRPSHVFQRCTRKPERWQITSQNWPGLPDFSCVSWKTREGLSMCQCSLVPRPHPLMGKRVWHTSEPFLVFADSAHHVNLKIESRE